MTFPVPDYPLLLNVRKRLCIVIGGGPVGIRKARGLLKAGACVRLVDPKAVADKELAGDVEVVRHSFIPTDLNEAFLVIAATNDPETNTEVVKEARSRGILVSRVDHPEEGDFTLPAILQRGDLTVTASTSGQSPALAALVRDQLAAHLAPEWGDTVAIVAALRRKRLTGQGKGEYNQSILRRLLEGGLLSLIASKDTEGIDRLLESVVGQGTTLSFLGLRGLNKG